MEVELQSLVDTQEITPQLAERLKLLTPGSCCRHRSWGAGKISSWDTTVKKLQVDFPGKSGHAMEFEYAVQSLKPLANDHIEARIVCEPDAVKKQAAEDHAELMANVVSSLGREATADRIQTILSPAVVPAADWKKWWDAAKRAMKKDTRFAVPGKRSEPIVLHEGDFSPESMLVEKLKDAVGAKAAIQHLDEIERHWKSLKDTVKVDDVLQAVDAVLVKVPSSQEALGLELHLSRLDFLETVGKQADPEKILGLFSSNPRDMVALIEQLPGARQSRCLQRIRQAKGAGWYDLAPLLMPLANSRMADVILSAYREDGRDQEAVALVGRLVKERSLHHDFLIWLGKNRKKPQCAPLINVDLFYAVLTVLEFDQMGGTRKAGRLSDFLLTDKGFLADMLAGASEDQVRDVVRSLLLTAAYDELDKRSLLAALVKLYPFVQGMISKGDAVKTEVATQQFIVSWTSLERRRKELEEIVNKKIPENSKEIGVARSYGDLRENHEFKAAKEMQTVLMRRKAELESMLANAQGTDFADAATTEVNIGTTVGLQDIADGSRHEFTIYGAWDSAPEKGVISYMTSVASSLLKKKKDEEVEIPLEQGGQRRVKIVSIEKAKVPVPEN